MTSISSGISINSPHVRAIDTSKMKMFHISEAPEDMYQRFIDSQTKMLEIMHSDFPDTSKNPRYQAYATVEVNGKTVATIGNNGLASNVTQLTFNLS